MSCIRAALAPVEAASSGAQEKRKTAVAVRDGEVVVGFDEEKLTALLGAA